MTDPESECYNRGSCWIMGGKPSIARAFAEQSKSDLRKFLHCRAVELAPGGILQCFLSGRADLADPTNQTIPERRHRFFSGPDFESAWDDLIAEVRRDLNDQSQNLGMRDRILFASVILSILTNM